MGITREMEGVVGDVKVSVELITPQKATKMFGRNNPRGERIKRNRPLDERKVADFAAMMKEGRWVLNGSAIVFDEHGYLIDGQHRLMARIASMKPFLRAAVRGCEDEVIEKLDVGMSSQRQKEEAIGMAGAPDREESGGMDGWPQRCVYL